MRDDAGDFSEKEMNFGSVADSKMTKHDAISFILAKMPEKGKKPV